MKVKKENNMNDEIMNDEIMIDILKNITIKTFDVTRASDFLGYSIRIKTVLYFKGIEISSFESDSIPYSEITDTNNKQEEFTLIAKKRDWCPEWLWKYIRPIALIYPFRRILTKKV